MTELDLGKLIELRRAQPETAVLTKDFDPVALEKADGESGVLDGYGSHFWVVDSYGEATAPGAFATSIKTRGPKAEKPRIVLRYEHEHTIGVYTALDEDETGLKVEGKISNDGMYGSAVRAHLKDGVPYGMSIGYRRVKQRPATADDPLIFDSAPQYIIELAKQDIGNILILTEVKLLENSVVTFPAVDSALVTSYRSDLDLIQKALDRLDDEIKRGRLSEDHILHLRRIAAALPAVLDPDAGEMPAAPVDPQTEVGKRNYELEARLALLGIEL